MEWKKRLGLEYTTPEFTEQSESSNLERWISAVLCTELEINGISLSQG